MRFTLGAPRLLRRGVFLLAAAVLLFVPLAGWAGLGLARSLALLGSTVLIAVWAQREVSRLGAEGALVWDGQVWRGPQGRAWREVRPALDLQRALLIELRAPTDGARPRTAWLWLEEASDPTFWRALRRAVYSRAAALPQPPAQP
ncbi:MAG: hypothetical protein Fur0019_12130 [Tibeticola sp.]